VNKLYPKAKQSFESQSPSIDMDSDTIKWMLVKTAQAFNAAHQFVSDLTGANIVARSPALTSKSVTGGVFLAAAATFTAPAAGSICNLILFKDAGGADSANPLILLDDTGTNLPCTTDGNDVTITPNAAGIFAL
jgi:hypothetical protein